jgi:ethylbenzene dehydrogenase
MRITVSALAWGAALVSGGVFAAAPEWSRVPAKEIIVFYPGVTPMEWILKHGGIKGMRKGETCLECHEEELDAVGEKIAAGERWEPKPLPDKAGFITVAVQAARDEANLYLRFQWKQPPRGGGRKMDKANPVKIAFMLEDNQVEWANLGGCWATCHVDARTMPKAKSSRQTKYVVGGSLTSGKFYDLMQYRSGGGGQTFDGYVADQRVMAGGKGLLAAEGKHSGDTWTVTFTRKLAGGGSGDIPLVPGKSYNFGFAIHDDHAIGRFHHVSMGYTLGIDAKADLTASQY